MLCSRCEFLEEDALIALIEQLEKLDASETYPRRLNAKEVLITPKDGECVFLVADSSAKFIRKRLRIPRTHSETGIHRKESQRRISRRQGKSFNLKKQKMTKESTRICGLTQKLGKNFIYRHHIEPWSSTYVPREESFLISSDLHYRTKLLREIYGAEGGMEKSQNIWGKNKFNFVDIAGKDGFLFPFFSQEFVPMKRSQESS